jgi:CRP/FNR family cyclic AMP-dependent transcriptional regulator
MDAAAAELIAHPLFSPLSVTAQRDILQAAVRRRARRQEIVYSPGDGDGATYWVRRGCIKVSRLSPDGREITLCLCHPGELFGEEVAVATGPRSCQAQALEESSLFLLPSPLIQRLMREEAAFAVALAHLVGLRRQLAEDQVENLAFRDVGGRLALLLLSLADRPGTVVTDGRTLISTRLTHQELANCVGTTRETLTLTIDRFKADGWIRLEGRMIAICEPDALRARAADGRWPRNDGRAEGG